MRHEVIALALVPLVVACATEPVSIQEVPPTPAEPEDSLPAILAAPELLPPQVARSGKKADVELSWTAVRDASAYRVEVAKLLTFTRLVKEARVETTAHRFEGLRPAVYFWRVCAESAGAQACSPKTVVNALPVTPRASSAPSRSAGRPIRQTAPVAVAVTPAPEEHTPSPEVEPEPLPAAPAAAAERNFKPVRRRYRKLQAELDEIRALRRDLAQTIRDLERTIETRGSEANVAELREELKRIEETRAELDREITVALAELDRLSKRK